MTSPVQNQSPQPRRQLSQLLAADSLANFLRFAVTALSLAAITPVLTRALEPDVFAVWTLVFTVSTYVAIAGAGAATAVTRFVSVDRATETGATAKILASVTWTIVGSVAFGIGLIATIAYRTDWLFRETPTQLVDTARATIVTLAFASGIGTVGIALHGYFFSLHRAIVPSLVVVATRIAVATGLAVAAIYTKSLLWLAGITLSGAVLSTQAMISLTKRNLGEPVVAVRNVRRSWILELVKHSSTIMIWSLTMVAIAGIDVVVVGAYDFGAVGAYGIAAQAVSLVLGLTNAFLSPLVAVAARHHSQGDQHRLAAVMIQFSRLGGTLLVATSSAMFIMAPWLVEIYAGEQYAATATPLLRILVVANVFRNTCSALVTTLIGAGAHRSVLAPTVAEAIVNVSLSLWLVQMFNAQGVALATLLAAAVGVGAHIVITLRQARVFTVSIAHFTAHAIGRPTLACMPTAAVYLAQLWFGINTAEAIPVAVFGTLFVGWRFSLAADDRRRLRKLLESRARPSAQSQDC